MEHLEIIPEQRKSLDEEFCKLIPMNNQTSNTLNIETRWNRITCQWSHFTQTAHRIDTEDHWFKWIKNKKIQCIFMGMEVSTSMMQLSINQHYQLWQKKLKGVVIIQDRCAFTRNKLFKS